MDVKFACFSVIQNIEFDAWNKHLIIKTKYGDFRVFKSNKKEFEINNLCIYCELKIINDFIYPMILPLTFISRTGYINFDFDVATFHWVDDLNNNELLFTMIDDTEITKIVNSKFKHI